MERYSFLRAFADSWVLLALFVAFVAAILFVWRPGSRKEQDDAATSIFRNEGHPAPDPDTIDPRESGADEAGTHKTDKHGGK